MPQEQAQVSEEPELKESEQTAKPVPLNGEAHNEILERMSANWYLDRGDPYLA